MTHLRHRGRGCFATHQSVSTSESVSPLARDSENGIYGMSAAAYSGLMLANLTTLPHFSVSSAINLPKSDDESDRTVPPKSASRVLIFGSARPALISLFSLSTISIGV